MIGMYIHQHWPYKRPYAARTWTLEDWRGYADGLKKIGYNTLLIWPMLETMPDPLTPSDQRALTKISKVIDMLHNQLDMRAYIVLCPNIVADNKEASRFTFETRHYYYCESLVNPADSVAMKKMMDRRSACCVLWQRWTASRLLTAIPAAIPAPRSPNSFIFWANTALCLTACAPASN